MKLTLERDTLFAALDRVGRVVERRNTIPVLANLLLKTRVGALTIVGTDLDMEAATTISAEIEDPGEITIPAETATKFTQKLPAGAKVSIATEPGKEGRITLKSGRSRATLPTLEAADFPDLNAQAPNHTFSLPAASLLDMLDRVAFAISSEETRYYLNGIHMHVTGPEGSTVGGAAGGDGPELVTVATDGHRLALRRTLAPEGTSGMPAIIIPRKAVTEMARLLKPLDETSVSLEVSSTKLRLVAGATTLTTKLIDGTFPDYARVVPGASKCTALLSADALGAAVDRVATVSTERSRAVKFTFGAEGGALVGLSVSGPDIGSATDDVAAESWAGDPLEIGFNGGYVLDLLKALPGKAPKVSIALTDAGSPALVTTEGNDRALFVLMPMRV